MSKLWEIVEGGESWVTDLGHESRAQRAVTGGSNNEGRILQFGFSWTPGILDGSCKNYGWRRTEHPLSIRKLRVNSSVIRWAVPWRAISSAYHPHLFLQHQSLTDQLFLRRCGKALELQTALSFFKEEEAWSLISQIDWWICDCGNDSFIQFSR